MRHGMGQPAFLPPKLIDLVEKNMHSRDPRDRKETQFKQILEQEKKPWLVGQLYKGWNYPVI